MGLTDVPDSTQLPLPSRVHVHHREFLFIVSFSSAIMKFTSVLFVLLSLFHLPGSFGGIIRDFLQNNVAGPSVNFQQQIWAIDPEAGLRRRKDYVEANGLYGFKHVERVGLGEDGRTDERRAQQQLRDSVGALSYDVPP